MMSRATFIGAATLCMVGCARPTPPAAPTPPVETPAAPQTAELQEVTFYLAGMNRRLKIL